MIPAMLPRKRLGRTGVQVTALGLGGASLHGSYGRRNTEERALETVRRALELGIRYFDTSPGYGESERRMGLGLEGWPRSDYFLATKTGTGTQPKDYTAEGTLRSVERSLERLRTDYLDLLLIHDPDDFEPSFAPGGALEALERLKSEGVIRAIGLGVRSHEFHHRAIRDGRFDVILTYLDYTLIDQGARPLLEAARAADVGVVLGSPLATGFLTERPVGQVASERGMPEDHPWPVAAGALQRWARERGESLVRLALQFCLQEPAAAVTLAAALTPEEVEANVRAALDPVAPETWRALAEAGFPAGRLRQEVAG